MEDLYAWVDSVPLSRPKRNIARDFSDGVLMAEILSHFYPKLVTPPLPLSLSLRFFPPVVCGEGARECDRVFGGGGRRSQGEEEGKSERKTEHATRSERTRERERQGGRAREQARKRQSKLEGKT